MSWIKHINQGWTTVFLAKPYSLQVQTHRYKILILDSQYLKAKKKDNCQQLRQLQNKLTGLIFGLPQNI